MAGINRKTEKGGQRELATRWWWWDNRKTKVKKTNLARIGSWAIKEEGASST